MKKMVIISLCTGKSTIYTRTKGDLHVRNKKSVFRSLALVTQFGITMLVPILLCTLIGVYLGKRFQIPFITVPLFVIGALAGFRNVYVLAKKTYENKDEKDAKKIK